MTEGRQSPLTGSADQGTKNHDADSARAAPPGGPSHFRGSLTSLAKSRLTITKIEIDADGDVTITLVAIGVPRLHGALEEAARRRAASHTWRER